MFRGATGNLLDELCGVIVNELNSITAGNWGLSKKHKPDYVFFNRH